MKTIILAGGAGTRLGPLTRATNKHLLMVNDRPMIHFALACAAELGASETAIVTGPGWIDSFRDAVGAPSRWDMCGISYLSQDAPKGVAHALLMAREFADGEPCCVLLGDNVFLDPPTLAARGFFAQPAGAMVFLASVENPRAFGVAEIESDRIVAIHEKPDRPLGSLVVTGLYLYDGTVFDRIARLGPSTRGEFEVTDLNMAYLADHALAHATLDGRWIDCGEPETLLQAAALVASEPTALTHWPRVHAGVPSRETKERTVR